MAAAEVRRANQLIYDPIADLGTFTGDSDTRYDWQKDVKRLTREFDSDLKHRVFRLMCGGLAETELNEAMITSPASDGGSAYQHAFGIVNGIYVDEDQKDNEIADFLQIKHKPFEPIYSFTERFEKQLLRAKNIGFEPNDVIARRLMESYRTFEGNFNKEQDSS